MSETRILLIEDDPGYARLLREILSEAEGTSYLITWAGTLEDAMVRLSGSPVDIVLLDLGLPDADGTEALSRVAAAAPAAPIVVLSGLHDLDVALESMRAGAQEYLVKGQSEHVLLPRAIRYAIERKRLQDGVASARAEAERANAVKDEFLAMLGHELRNPLAPIVTALELMRQRDASAMARERAIIERQVQHLVRLVDDLLDVSRIARGKIELEREIVDMAEVVADGLETASPLFKRQRHKLFVDVPRGALFVDGDRSRLAQVTANLLTNAAKYTDPGGEVTVSARADGDHVELRVRDTGVGMTPELAASAFDLFKQGARTIDRAAGGLGLGLAIVKSLVTLHGGSVTATSEGPGKGSELVVRLPLRASSERAEGTSSAAAIARAQAPRRVLVVDDNEDAAALLVSALRDMGHAAQAARDGLGALDAALSFQPEVVLLDIGLPVMDGYEVARRMRALFGDRAPILVAVTGYGQESDRKRSREAGMDHHLVKPIELPSLAALIASVPR